MLRSSSSADLFEIVEAHRVHLDPRFGQHGRQVRMVDRLRGVLAGVVGFDDDYEVGIVDSAQDLVRPDASAYRPRRHPVVDRAPCVVVGDRWWISNVTIAPPEVRGDVQGANPDRC